GARARAERAGEEGVEARVLAGIGLLGLGHVGAVVDDEIVDERVLHPRELYPREPVHHGRQQMLRQQVLEPDEQPRSGVVGAHVGCWPAAETRCGAARRRSAASADASKGGVKTATIPRASTRNSTAE